jgi:hypothetical protein
VIVFTRIPRFLGISREHQGHWSHFFCHAPHSIRSLHFTPLKEIHLFWFECVSSKLRDSPAQTPDQACWIRFIWVSMSEGPLWSHPRIVVVNHRICQKSKSHQMRPRNGIIIKFFVLFLYSSYFHVRLAITRNFLSERLEICLEFSQWCVMQGNERCHIPGPRFRYCIVLYWFHFKSGFFVRLPFWLRFQCYLQCVKTETGDNKWPKDHKQRE